MKTPSALQRSGVRDSDAMMSAKVNMEAPPKEPDRTPLDPSASASLSSSEAVLVCGSDGVAKKARPQTHTTTAFLLPGEHGGGSVVTWVYRDYPLTQSSTVLSSTSTLTSDLFKLMITLKREHKLQGALVAEL